ncbi:MAG: hypothetical protein MOGMAGMI_02471 [Candidatus Omnitrophica bacterium]|nr:hypothetical protein [Candidatus Omnitrophota bacterium]
MGALERISNSLGRAVGAFRYGISDVMLRGIGQDAALSRNGRMWFPNGTPASPASPSDEARYSTSDDVYAAVRLLATCAATCPYQVLVNGEHDPEHDLQILIERANRWQGGLDFWTRAYSWLWLLGECFVIIERGNPYAPAMPNALWAVSGRYMRVKAGDGEEYVASYKFVPPGKGESAAIDIDPQDVIPLLLWNPADPLRGLSPLTSLRNGLDAEREAKSANRDLFRNGPMADVVISPAGDAFLQPPQREHLEASLDKRLGDTGKRHRPLVLPGGVRVDAVRLTPRDAEFIELDKLTTRDVAKAYQIPSMFLGQMDAATFRNYETGYRALWEHAIVPVVRAAAATMTVTIAPQFGDNVEIVADEDFIKAKLQDEKSIADTMGVLVRAGYDRLLVARMFLGDHIDEAFVSDLVPVVLQEPADAAATVAPTRNIARRSSPKRRAAAVSREAIRDSAAAARGELEGPATDDMHAGLGQQCNRVLAAWKALDPNRMLRRDADTDYAAIVFPDWSDDPLVGLVAGVIGNGVERGAADATELFDLSFDEGRVRDESLAWAKAAAADEVRYINETTRGFLRTAIADGLAAGETPIQIEKRIREAFSQSEPDEADRYANRPRMIAETEIGAAYNHGSNAALEAAGMTREWLWSGNPQDTRHDGIDGQKRNPGEAFDVRGYAGQYPGDPSLPAGERVNCKCSVGAALEDDDA